MASFNNDSKFMYSEIFYSIQGEGHYTGRPTMWLRYFLCNLQCDGFGQKDPTNPATWELPYESLDVSKYAKMTDLPVFKYGCDSSYSWAKKFKGLQEKGTAVEIADRITSMLAAKQPASEGMFRYWRDGAAIDTHMCFTGGEPLMPHAQACTAMMLKHWKWEGNAPRFITFETNGTQYLTNDFYNLLLNKGLFDGEVFFSISPKLFRITGEKATKALKVDTIAEYHTVSRKGQLKFVLNDDLRAWDDMEQHVEQLRAAGVYYPVWIMNAGATLEGQRGEVEGHCNEAKVAEIALSRGYNYATRAHVHIWGNTIGT